MTYLGTGLAWANTLPAQLEDDGLCDCGRAKAPGDFLCWQCGEKLAAQFLARRNESVLAQFADHTPAPRLASPCDDCPDRDECPGGFGECGA
jgi:hypothetical protein